jgi:tRNA (guanine-N7-)-methyltransferase
MPDRAGASRVPWSAVFGNDRRVEVEIGPGRGELLLALAAGAPSSNFFAVERSAGAAAAIMARAAQRGVPNVRVIAGDARCVVGRLVPDGSVAAYHLYFPDPWPKTRHRERRLASETFARDLARTLAPGGEVDVASDVRPLVDGFAALLTSAGLAREPGARPPAGRPTTSFERRYARDGTHYVRFVRPP